MENGFCILRRWAPIELRLGMVHRLGVGISPKKQRRQTRRLKVLSGLAKVELSDHIWVHGQLHAPDTASMPRRGFRRQGRLPSQMGALKDDGWRTRRLEGHGNDLWQPPRASPSIVLPSALLLFFDLTDAGMLVWRAGAYKLDRSRRTARF